jgi:CheY-like chemotaxis protein
VVIIPRHCYNKTLMPESEKTAYCISCGEDVPVTPISIGIDGEELLQCRHCLSFLGTSNKPQTLSEPAEAPKVVPPGEPAGDFHPDETKSGSAIMPDMPNKPDSEIMLGGGEEPEQDIESPPLETVVTVEDSNLISAMLNDMLVEKGLTRKVIPCKNGYEFLGRYICETKLKTKIGLVVMDVKMPVLNGISAAVAMRAHEKAMRVDHPPILFFTSKRCDETFRKVLVHSAPAMYINKGSSTSPEHLQDRISKVIGQLLREEW